MRGITTGGRLFYLLYDVLGCRALPSPPFKLEGLLIIKDFSKKKRLFTHAALAVIVLLSAWSCSKPFTQVHISAREDYRFGVSDALLKGQSVAILTATGSELGVEHRKLLGDILEDVLSSEREDIPVTPYWESLSIINEAGLVKDYADMLDDYNKTGVLGKAGLQTLGKAIGVKNFIQPRLVAYKQLRSKRFGALGLSLINTHETIVKVFVEIWNAESGRLLWIGVSEINIASERYSSKPIAFEKAARLAVVDLIKKMP